MNRRLNVAHRGSSEVAPENTLNALATAVAHGADMVEVDVHRTRDGALVVLHDNTLSRTTNVASVFPRRGPWRVADFNLAEIQRLDAGTWKAARHEGAQVPTLDEVLTFTQAHEIGLLLEVKTPGQYPGIMSDLAAELRLKAGYLATALPSRRLLVQSFDTVAMRDFKGLAPEVPVGILGSPAKASLAELGSWAGHVNPSYLKADRGYVGALHDAGLECLVWTVNRPMTMRRMLSLGVDGIITNRPAALANLLGRPVAQAA